MYNCRLHITHFFIIYLYVSLSISINIYLFVDGADNERLTLPGTVKDFYVKYDIKLVIVTVDIKDPVVIRTLRELATEEKFFIDASSDPIAIKLALQRGFKMVTSGNLTMEAL